VGLALLGVAGLLILMAEPIAPPLSRGDLAPPFALPSLADGAPVALEDLRGRVVLVNFWATWCKPCEEEMPAMQNLYRALGKEGFALIAVAVDRSRDDVVAFRERLGIDFPIVLDPAEKAAARYQTTGFPESILVDADGVIVERYIGPREWDHPYYVARIRRLIDAPD
jgi:thiol-disulfide isomerase/thioredoxin